MYVCPYLLTGNLYEDRALSLFTILPLLFTNAWHIVGTHQLSNEYTGILPNFPYIKKYIKQNQELKKKDKSIHLKVRENRN